MKFHEISVSAPSKVILFGEHAVVYGMTAVAASLGLRTRMRIRPHGSKIIVNFPDVELQEAWAPIQLQNLFQHKPDFFDQVDAEYLDRIHDFLKVDKCNLRMASVICFLYLYSVIMDEVGVIPMEIRVESEIPVGAGLGSSAALSVCLASGLTGVLHQIQANKPQEDIFSTKSAAFNRTVCKYAFLSEKILHGNPSGIDNSISTYGGIRSFKAGELTPVESLRKLRILLVNTNTFRNTKDLVLRVKEKKISYPEIIEPVLEAIDGISTRFISAGNLENDTEYYNTVQDLIQYNQSLLTSLGVSHPTLDDVCLTLKKVGMVGKLTGAGGGGFALALVPPSLPEKLLVQAVDMLEIKGYTCYQTGIGVHGFTIEKS
jgi:mevalonate kinase